MVVVDDSSLAGGLVAHVMVLSDCWQLACSRLALFFIYYRDSANYRNDLVHKQKHPSAIHIILRIIINIFAQWCIMLNGQTEN